jgi:hypothetical protein
MARHIENRKKDVEVITMAPTVATSAQRPHDHTLTNIAIL